MLTNCAVLRVLIGVESGRRCERARRNGGDGHWWHAWAVLMSWPKRRGPCVRRCHSAALRDAAVASGGGAWGGWKVHGGGEWKRRARTARAVSRRDLRHGGVWAARANRRPIANGHRRRCSTACAPRAAPSPCHAGAHVTTYGKCAPPPTQQPPGEHRTQPRARALRDNRPNEKRNSQPRPSRQPTPPPALLHTRYTRASLSHPHSLIPPPPLPCAPTPSHPLLKLSTAPPPTIPFLLPPPPLHHLHPTRSQHVLYPHPCLTASFPSPLNGPHRSSPPSLPTPYKWFPCGFLPPPRCSPARSLPHPCCNQPPSSTC